METGAKLVRGELLLARLKEVRDDNAALELLDLFQSGFPLARLRELLSESRENAIRAGIWIASELGAQIHPLLPEIARLLKHADRYVRFFAVDCVLAAANENDGVVLGHTAELLYDQDSAVRWKAMNFLAAASGAVLVEAIRQVTNVPLREQLEWLEHAELLGPASIHAKLASSDAADAVVGAIAAARIADEDSTALRAATQLPLGEARDFARERLARIRQE